jgi:KDO2-lipid IV(A) lauroyltransferase
MASWLAGRVPRPLRLAIAGPLTTLVYYFWAAKRRVTIANMAQILGVAPSDPRARRLARDSWRNYGRYLSDFFYLPNATPKAILARLKDVSPAPGAYALIDAARARGKGLLIATPHFGAWDVAGVLVGAHTPLHVLVDSFDDPRMDALIQQQRRDLGMEVMRVEKSPRAILRVLKDNGTVAIVADRPLPKGEGTPVTFFGKQCYVPGGVAQLALLTGAAIAPGYAWYDANYSSAYYGYLDEPFYPDSTGDRQADTQRLTQRIYDAFERTIRERPEQWAMFRPFWPDEDAAETAETTHATERATPIGAAHATAHAHATADALIGEQPEGRVRRVAPVVANIAASPTPDALSDATTNILSEAPLDPASADSGRADA